jgi:hypothetical protein
MQERRSAIRIVVDDHTRATLGGWLRKQKTLVAFVKRAKTMLLLAEAYSFAATARQVDLREMQMRKWRIVKISEVTLPKRCLYALLCCRYPSAGCAGVGRLWYSI